MSCGCNSGSDCAEPIPEVGQVFTVTTTPQSLADMGFTASSSSCTIQVSILQSSWRLVPIGRWSKDSGASISDTVGRLIFPFSKICLNEFETGAIFRSVSGEFEILVQEFVEPVVCDFRVPYLGVLQKLLPSGFAWEAKQIEESNLYKLLNAAAKIASDLHCRALELTNEFFASSSVEFQNQWANESFNASLNECLVNASLNQREKILTILAKARGAGAYRASDFEEIASVLGLEVSITDDPAAFTMTFDFIGANVAAKSLCDMTACSRLFDGADMNFMLAYKCLMNKVAPAQSQKVFLIDGDC